MLGTVILRLLLLTSFVDILADALTEHHDLPLILRYEDSSPMFDLLPQSKGRVKRASYNLPQQKAAVEQEGPDMWNTHIPDDVEEEKENSTVGLPPIMFHWLNTYYVSLVKQTRCW
ncbi:hypothetical protein Y032_0012g1769 [Ancylostoma ceylanicum]|uniref:Uncharacterized protein n=1 Tax=Ancylostoma ceylanicum TaxID=53326 RepID=A0A016VCR2_9BILA|nr:hypothetical protein Y032_0012g1769 [Ancylostoma ceylanicum]